MLSDAALDRIALDRGIKIGKEELEEEVNYLNLEAAHQRQYAALMHGMDLLELNADESAREALIAQALRNLRIRRLIDDTIREQAFQVTQEDLEAEAEGVARRQNVSVDMVRGFFGPDLGMLKSDVLEQKALQWLETHQG
mgnify:CR=1 FL=1